MPELSITVPLAPAAEDAILDAVERSGVLMRYADPSNTSGVLVELVGHFFIFTAAHAFDVDPPTLMILSEGPGPNRRSIALTTPPGGGGWAINGADAPDAGVIEIDPAPLGREWLSRRAVQAERLAAAVAHELPARSLPVAICGIPTAQRRYEDGVARHLGQIAQTLHAVELVEAGAPTRLPIWMNTEAVDRATGQRVKVAGLAGVSGGGVWTADSTATPYLLATHQGRAPVEHEGRELTFAFATLLSAHLAIVASALPALAPFIIERWPCVIEVADHYRQDA